MKTTIIIFVVPMVCLIVYAILTLNECNNFDIATNRVINEFDGCKLYELKNSNKCGNDRIVYSTVCENGKTKTSWDIVHGKTTKRIEVETNKK